MSKSREDLEGALWEKSKFVLIEVTRLAFSLGYRKEGVDQNKPDLVLLQKIYDDTESVTIRPTKEGLAEYKKLQEQVSKHPKMQKVGAAMLMFTGALIEVVITIPRILNPFDKHEKANAIFETGSALFKKGNIASRMKEHHEKLSNEPEVKSPTRKL